MKAFISAVAFLGLSAVIHARPNEAELKVGQVIGSENGQIINGWEHVGGGMIPRRVTADYVTKETLDCCFVIFQKQQSTLIARTTPVAKNPTGGILAERIEEIVKLDAKPGEIGVGDCSILWISPAWTLVNEQTKLARSAIVTTDGIRMLSWVDDDSTCFSGA